MSTHGKNKKRRPGVHKHRRSPETLAWEREHLIPRRPHWMPESVYVALAAVREKHVG